MQQFRCDVIYADRGTRHDRSLGRSGGRPPELLGPASAGHEVNVMNTEINKEALSKSVELSVRSRNQLANAIESAVMPLLIGTTLEGRGLLQERPDCIDG